LPCLGLENYGGLGLEIQSLGLDNKVLFTSLHGTYSISLELYNRTTKGDVRQMTKLVNVCQ